MNIHVIKTQSKELKGLLDEVLKEKLQSEVAKLLNIKAPQLSNLYKVISEIIDKVEDEQSLDSILNNYNNVGKKTIKNLKKFIEVLKIQIEEDYQEQNEYQSYGRIWHNAITNSESKTANKIERAGLLGLYECYSHSTTKAKLLKAPMMIRRNEHDNSLEVIYKSKMDRYSCRGIIFLVGSHLITIYLIDDPEDIGETTSIHLSMPLMSNPQILRGIRLNIDVGKQPHGGRIIVKRIGDVISENEFNTISDEYIDYDEMTIPEVKSYLQNSRFSSLKCNHISNPSDTWNDLLKEKEAIELWYEDFAQKNEK